MTTAALDRYLHALETLSPASLEALTELLDPQVRFRDPFQDVVGPRAFIAVFRHMFEHLDDVRFVVVHRAPCAPPTAGDALVHWRLEARFKSRGEPWQVEGCALLSFNTDGLLTAHFDYWNAADDFYARLPLLGSLLRFVRRRMRLPHSDASDQGA